MFGFFLSFAVIGYYWIAHHRLVAQLQSLDRGLIALHLPYLALVAFLPFPTAMLGDYPNNPVALGAYSLVVGILSGLEWVMMRHARRGGHLRRRIPDGLYRWATAASLMPSFLFLASVPVAFLSTTAAYLMWVANAPAQLLWDRRRPVNPDDYSLSPPVSPPGLACPTWRPLSSCSSAPARPGGQVMPSRRRDLRGDRTYAEHATHVEADARRDRDARRPDRAAGGPRPG